MKLSTGGQQCVTVPQQMLHWLFHRQTLTKHLTAAAIEKGPNTQNSNHYSQSLHK